MSKLKKNYIHYAIALVLGLLIALLVKPTADLTAVGVRFLAVTASCLYLWLTVGTDWTSILYMALLVMTGAMTGTEVWAGSMGHFSVISMIVFMILNYALMQTGVINLVCNWFITRNVVKNRPYMFISMFLGSMLVLGMFMDNLSLAVIYVGIAEVLCGKLKLEKGEPFYTCMFIGIMWVDCIISIASPIAHAPCLILMGYMSTYLSINVSYAAWLAVGIPFAIIMFVAIVITILIWKPNATKYENYDVEAERANAPKLGKKGKITVTVFLAAIALMIFPEIFKILGILPGFTSFWTTVGNIAIAMLAVAALCIIGVDGEPVLNMPMALKSLPMGAIIFAGVVCVMSTPINTTGVGAWLTSLLAPLGNMNPLATMVILCVGALVMTNFMSNVVTMTLFFNIGVGLLNNSSTAMGAFAFVIGIASSMAFMTPSACAPMPLVFGPGHVTMKGTYRYNLILLFLSLVIMLCLVYPFAQTIIK